MHPPPPPEGPARGMLPRTGRIVLAALTLAALAMYVRVPAIASAFHDARLLPIVAAAVLLAPNIGFQHAKWLRLLRRAAPATTPAEAAVSLFSGFAYGLITPARLGEFGARAATSAAAGRSRVIGLTAIDKSMSFAVTVGIGLLGSAAYLLRIGYSGPFLFILPAAALLGCAALLRARALRAALIRFTERGRFAARRGFSGRLARAAADALHGITLVQRVDAPALAALSAGFYLTFIAQYVILLGAFGPVDIPAAILGTTAMMLIKTVVPPITLGELGIREGAAVFVFPHIGVPGAAALNAALLLFAINVAAPAIAGALLVLRAPHAPGPAT